MKMIALIWNRIKAEPPIAAATVIIVFFSLPVLVGIAERGYILLPPGYTYTLAVQPLFGIIAILIDLVLLFLFAVSPVVRLNFHSIVTPDIWRKAAIWGYIIITWVCLYIFNARLNFISSLLNDPVATMLSLGSELVDNKLLGEFFLAIGGCLGYALIRKEDGWLLKATGFITMVGIALFYFFVGRREISLMTLCFLLLLKKEKLSRQYLAVVFGVSVAVLIFVLSLRVDAGGSSGSMYATDSEELSPIAYSAYVIQHTTPDVIGSFAGATPLRSKLVPLSISAAFFLKQSGYNDVSAPVLGVGGATYMYGFIIPVIELVLIGMFARSVTNEFKKKKTPVLKLLLIYMTFKTINIFRNGEFPIVMIDILLFFVLSLPALYLNFKKPVYAAEE
jgi:hypothetical protein